MVPTRREFLLISFNWAVNLSSSIWWTSRYSLQRQDVTWSWTLWQSSGIQLCCWPFPSEGEIKSLNFALWMAEMAGKRLCFFPISQCFESSSSCMGYYPGGQKRRTPVRWKAQERSQRGGKGPDSYEVSPGSVLTESRLGKYNTSCGYVTIHQGSLILGKQSLQYTWEGLRMLFQWFLKWICLSTTV